MRRYVQLTAIVTVFCFACPGRAAPETDVFGLAKVHEFHLELTAREWATLQQVKGGMNFGLGGAGKKPDTPAEKVTDVHKGGSFAMEFPWAHATLTADRKTYKDIGVRYKGGGSYLASMGKLRRNFKVQFDHYDEECRFHGLGTVSLNSGAADPTRGREGLAFAVYRAAGVPAPRTAYAEVTLSVPGKYDKEVLGLYTLIEQVDKAFLKSHFKNGNGLLMKPEGSAGGRWRLFDYRGDDWETYKTITGPKREPTKKEAQRLIDFTRLILKADDATFAKEVGTYLDVDQFLRFLGCTAYLSNMDSAFTTSHNVYIYLNPVNNKFVLIPWDLDLACAGFPLMGTPEKLMNLSLMRPYPGENKLVERLLADKQVKARYLALLRELTTTAFNRERMLRDVEVIEKVTKEILTREAKAAASRKEFTTGQGLMGGANMFGKTPDLRAFIDKRALSVAAQLDGKARGFVPASIGFFIPEGKGKGPLGFDPTALKIGNMMAPPLIVALDTDEDGKLSRNEWLDVTKRLFAAGEKDAQGRVSEKGIAAALNGMFPKPAEGAPAPPLAFNLGNFMAGPIVKRADQDKDGMVTLDELVSSAGKLFDEFDKSKTGMIDEAGFSDLLTAIFPAFNLGLLGGKAAAPKGDDKKEKEKSP